MNNYFDNASVTKLVAEYQLHNPQSEEAKTISHHIMIEANKIIRAVIYTFRLHRYSSYDETFSHGQEKVLMCLKNYNPRYGTLYNYITSTVRRGCTNENKRAYKKRLNSVVEVQITPNLATNTFMYNELNGSELWNEYHNAFTERPYLLPVFKEMCMIIDDDPTHVTEWFILGTLTSRKHLFKNAHGNPMKSRREVWKYLGWIKEIIHV